MSPQPEPLKLTVPAALEGERLDRGLALLAGLSRARAAQVVAEGHARVGGAALRSGSRRLRSGEVLEVELPGRQVFPGERPPTGGGEGARPDSPRATLLYVDDDVIVVDKPAGLVVHPGAGNAGGTLVQQLLDLFPDLAAAGPDGARPGVVHRLDKGTSGLLVVARNEAAREALVRQMSARLVERYYLVLVHGKLGASDGLIDAPVARSPSHRLKMAVVHGGRAARTHYRVLGTSGASLESTLLACRLETGRTHQVRVHFAAIGHPVVGDATYATPTQSLQVRAALPELERPWLHAARLGFTHPVSGAALSFSSPPPRELETVLTALALALPDSLLRELALPGGETGPE